MTENVESETSEGSDSTVIGHSAGDSRGPAAGAERRWGKYRVDRGPITDDGKNLLVLTVVGHPSSVSGSGARGRRVLLKRLQVTACESQNLP